MSSAFQPNLNFGASVEAVEPDDVLMVDLEGYEGPLHVLLALARNQKVDLLKLSITRLAEQYLAFVHEARRRNFALAADYLVMASWLAYLKSRLLLPRHEGPAAAEVPAEELAAALAFRLRKLEAMRNAADALMRRPILRRDVFTRGDPEARVIVPSGRIDAGLYELMGAYVNQRRRAERRSYNPGLRVEAFPLEAARDWLRERLPQMEDWVRLDEIAPGIEPAEQADEEPEAMDTGPSRASYRASTFSAGLELVKEGALEVNQAEAFADLYLRRRQHGQPLELNP